MANNIDLGSLNFRCTKNSFFIFLAQKMGFFCEASTKIMFQKWTNTILNDTMPYFMQVVCMEKNYSHPSRN
jgi:hypothetical protein